MALKFGRDGGRRFREYFSFFLKSFWQVGKRNSFGHDAHDHISQIEPEVFMLEPVNGR